MQPATPPPSESKSAQYKTQVGPSLAGSSPLTQQVHQPFVLHVRNLNPPADQSPKRESAPKPPILETRSTLTSGDQQPPTAMMASHTFCLSQMTITTGHWLSQWFTRAMHLQLTEYTKHG